MHTFPYQYKRIAQEVVFNPFIYIPVKTPSGWQHLWFLVDSGADTTTLTLPLAKQLGLSYTYAGKTKLFGIGERSVDAYPGEIILKLGKLELNVRSYFINSPDSTLLLGRLDVFEKFNITFDSRQKEIVFQPIS